MYLCIVNSREELTKKDAFVPLFRNCELGHFTYNDRGNGLNVSLHCIVYMRVAYRYGSVEQFTDLYFVIMGVQAQQLEITVRMDGSTSCILSNLDANPSQICTRIKMKKKVLYLAPVVEVLDAHVEKGFMGSGSNTPNNPNDGHGTQPLTEGETLFL